MWEDGRERAWVQFLFLGWGKLVGLPRPWAAGVQLGLRGLVLCALHKSQPADTLTALVS